MVLDVPQARHWTNGVTWSAISQPPAIALLSAEDVEHTGGVIHELPVGRTAIHLRKGRGDSERHELQERGGA